MRNPGHKNQWQVTRSAKDPLSAAVAERDRDIMNMVRDAIATQNVLLAFQPVVQTAQPNRPAFYEGLIRVLDTTGRIIPAKEFIDVIKAHEMGRQIDFLALQLGLQTLSDVPGLRLSINMSARSIGYPLWMEVLNRGLELGPTVAERLILEITESSAMICGGTSLLTASRAGPAGQDAAESQSSTVMSASCLAG